MVDTPPSWTAAQGAVLAQVAPERATDTLDSSVWLSSLKRGSYDQVRMVKRDEHIKKIRA
jgi:hypothetical protein